ncbi:MAG: 50S ribosomal protein L10 [Candidatus Pacebacteria bacterium]|nr:50S ribosomal protein L10 [Candidatus Paceibacterota bacterium]
MAITREKKKDILARLQDEVVKAKTIVLVNFHGLSVLETSNLRRSLREATTKFFVAKKTLIKKAFTEAGFEGAMPEMEGEIAVAYGEDQLAVPKGVYEYEKKTSGLVKIVGGVLNGTYADQKLMVTMAQIPPREVLLAQFLNIINSPLQGLAVALNEIAKKKN